MSTNRSEITDAIALAINAYREAVERRDYGGALSLAMSIHTMIEALHIYGTAT